MKQWIGERQLSVSIIVGLLGSSWMISTRAVVPFDVLTVLLGLGGFLIFCLSFAYWLDRHDEGVRGRTFELCKSLYKPGNKQSE